MKITKLALALGLASALISPTVFANTHKNKEEGKHHEKKHHDKKHEKKHHDKKHEKKHKKHKNEK